MTKTRTWQESNINSAIQHITGTNVERDKTVSILGMNTPLWASELIGLKVGDVFGLSKTNCTTASYDTQINEDIKKEINVRARTAKFHEEYTISIEDDIQQAIKEFIEWKAQNGESIDRNAPLFVSHNGEHMNIGEVYEIITKLFNNIRD